MGKKVAFFVLGIASAFYLTGCASIFSKSKYDVIIQSNAPRAKVKIQDSASGAILAKGDLPYTINLKAAKGFFDGASYMVEVYTSDKKQQYRAINASVDPWLFGNFILGGIIGIAVDGATGAMYKLDDTCYVHFSEYDNGDHEIDDNNTIRKIQQKEQEQKKDQPSDKAEDTKKVAETKTNASATDLKKDVKYVVSNYKSEIDYYADSLVMGFIVGVRFGHTQARKTTGTEAKNVPNYDMTTKKREAMFALAKETVTSEILPQLEKDGALNDWIALQNDPDMQKFNRRLFQSGSADEIQSILKETKEFTASKYPAFSRALTTNSFYAQCTMRLSFKCFDVLSGK